MRFLVADLDNRRLGETKLQGLPVKAVLADINVTEDLRERAIRQNIPERGTRYGVTLDERPEIKHVGVERIDLTNHFPVSHDAVIRGPGQDVIVRDFVFVQCHQTGTGFVVVSLEQIGADTEFLRCFDRAVAERILPDCGEDIRLVAEMCRMTTEVERRTADHISALIAVPDDLAKCNQLHWISPPKRISGAHTRQRGRSHRRK